MIEHADRPRPLLHDRRARPRRPRHRRRHADEVIAAVERYHADHGDYPHRLDALVPRYLPRVPSAKYTLAHHAFEYWTHEGGATLMYYLGPFARRVYSFERHGWMYMD
jgi:hypothetical protein